MVKLVDCTLRDGGYYNNWDFSIELIEEYLISMQALSIDFVEIGFRSLKNDRFKGGCAFSTDNFLKQLNIPFELKESIGVMVNGSELINHSEGIEFVLDKLFVDSSKSPVNLVRIACHIHEFESCLTASHWLKDKGYTVGFNLMQIADRALEEISKLARRASSFPVDVLYFADSMGSLTPEKTAGIVKAFQKGWCGDLGIHTHDNMGMAQANSLEAIKSGVIWVDSTVTGMGRGPGNAKTETIVLELENVRGVKSNITKLLEIVRKYFLPLQSHYGWGSNPYYFLAGKYGIHPSYIQEMLGDSRYDEEDILSVIEHLKGENGKKFNLGTLEAARHFFRGESRGSWSPLDLINEREVLILGTGPSLEKHRNAIEMLIKERQPYVIALNTQKAIAAELIDVRASCHPVRLLADSHEHLVLPQPLITPASMLPRDVRSELEKKELLDFGLSVKADCFQFRNMCCTLPSSLVIGYALAIATSGGAKKILLAGFDGYGAEDPRRAEVETIFKLYQNTENSRDLISITPTLYEIPCGSVYAMTN